MPFNHPLVFAIVISTLSIAACGGSSGGGSDDAAGSSMVALGKALFFDEDLSSNGNQSCGSCHDPVAGFADPDATVAAPVSAGSLSPATFGNRNAPTAAYASLIPPFVKLIPPEKTDGDTFSNFQGGQFLDGRSSTLIDQAKAPFLNPAEMNNVDEADVVSKIQNASYADDFREVFGANAFNDTLQAYNNIAVAIAAFETSSEMNPFTSKFDAVMAGRAAFDLPEQRGFELFKGTKAKCANCHTVNDPATRSLFTDFKYYNIGTPINPDNPVYDYAPAFRDDGLGDSPAIDPVDKPAEQGKFRTPTLRNVELTAPYMHNGVYDTLEEVITHYDIQIANGFITPEVNTNIANELDEGGLGLGLQPRDSKDLKAFMLTLTDGFM